MEWMNSPLLTLFGICLAIISATKIFYDIWKGDDPAWLLLPGVVFGIFVAVVPYLGFAHASIADEAPVNGGDIASSMTGRTDFSVSDDSQPSPRSSPVAELHSEVIKEEKSNQPTSFLNEDDLASIIEQGHGLTIVQLEERNRIHYGKNAVVSGRVREVLGFSWGYSMSLDAKGFVLYAQLPLDENAAEKVSVGTDVTVSGKINAITRGAGLSNAQIDSIR